MFALSRWKRPRGREAQDFAGAGERRANQDRSLDYCIWAKQPGPSLGRGLNCVLRTVSSTGDAGFGGHSWCVPLTAGDSSTADEQEGLPGRLSSRVTEEDEEGVE